MKLKIFTTELVTEWKKQPKSQMGLGGIIENKEEGQKGEKSALNRLRIDFPEYEFTQTDYSWTPADIIGFRKDSKFWHFALYQVKTSRNLNSLTEEIPEKHTLPDLAKILKEVFIVSDQTKYYKKKELYITIGYLGIYNSNGRNTIIKRVPYQNDFSMNGLTLTQSEKIGIKNKLHR
jgi:hypothetical protein